MAAPVSQTSDDVVTQRFPGADGLSLAVDVGGSSEAPPVLMLHGAGQTRHSWRRSAAALRRAGYRTLAADARGHGESGWAPEGKYATEFMAADLMAMIHHLGRAPALVGASMGGLTGLTVAGTHPEALRALVMVDVTPRLNPEGVQRIGEFMKGNPDGFASLEEAAEAISRYMPHRPKPSNPKGLSRNLVQGTDGRYRWHWDPAFVQRPYSEVEDRVQQLLSYAAQVKVPTLLIRGGSSEIVDEHAMDELRALIPHAEHVSLSGARHMVAGDDNDAFSSAITNFLLRVYPISEARSA